MAKLVAHLLATAALWVRIQTSAKVGDISNEWPTHSSPPKKRLPFTSYKSCDRYFRKVTKKPTTRILPKIRMKKDSGEKSRVSDLDPH